MIRRLELEEMKTDFLYGHACYRELQFGRPFDLDHMLTIWSHFYATETGIVLVEEQDGEKVGVIGGVLYVDPFDKNVVAQELIWYVLPHKRNLATAQVLREALEEWARKHGAKYIRMAVPDQKCGLAGLLKREQYRHLEEVFEKELI